MLAYRYYIHILRKSIAALVGVIFLTTATLPVYAQTALNLPIPGTMITSSVAFSPPIITGMTIHPENPLQFDFIFDIGDDRLAGESFRKEAKKLINYFMATLTVPENEMWVNLSPYEKNRIIADGLSKTELGRDMLAQDYILKQFTASLLYPEKMLGQKFWNNVKLKAHSILKTTDIPTDLINKVWIVPEGATVYVNGKNVFVTHSHLKVMLGQNGLALGNQERTNDNVSGNANAVSVIREVLLPEIEKEVNEGKNFATLRQIYNSMILATWFKKKLKASLWENIYLNKNKTNGIELEDKNTKEKIYNQYLQALKRGVYNYIREELDEETQETIARKYFSGGLQRVVEVSENPPSPLWVRQQAMKPHVVVLTEAHLLNPKSSSAVLQDTLQSLQDQLPLTFSPNEKDIVQVKNWPMIEQLGATGLNLTDETKQMIVLAIVKNQTFDESVQSRAGILQAISYFRQLHPKKRAAVLHDLRLLGYDSTAEWLQRNSNAFLRDLDTQILTQFGVQIDSPMKEFVHVHDQAVRRARGLRLALETVASLQGLASQPQTSQLIIANKNLRDVVFGLQNAAQVTIEDKDLPVITEMLWGLKQVEGIAINIIRLGNNEYYVYEEYHLKRMAQDQHLTLGVTTQGLEHLIKLDMAKKEGIFFELATHGHDKYDQAVTNISNSICTSHPGHPLVTWDANHAFWRATPITHRILEMERTEIETVYIATMDREVALRTQLEAEAESNRIFNRQAKLVIVDDSSMEILRANQTTLDDLYQRYGWESWHITPQEREKEYDEYARSLRNRYQTALDQHELPVEVEEILKSQGVLKAGQIDESLLRQYLIKNVFFHISGVRNRTVLKAKGESTIMSMDDDAPPETYVVKKAERDRIRQERLQAKDREMKNLMQKVGQLFEITITTEEELYFALADVPDSLKKSVDALLDEYFGYDPFQRAGHVPLAMDEIKVREAQMLDQNGWGQKLGISHQRYHGLMTPLPQYMLRVSDFVYPQPRTEKKQGQFDVLPVNVHRMGDLVGKKAGETDLPLMGSPLDGRGDLRGTMAQPIEPTKREALANKTIAYVAAPFIEDQDTSGIAQFIRYLEMERKKAANLQHANQSALLVDGIGGFIADTYVIFNRSAFSNRIVSPAIGRDLRLEEPPYILWVKSPMLENGLTVAYSIVAGGQQREIGERMYDINYQDYTEVVGVVARPAYERAVKKFYKILESRLDLQGEGKHYQRLRFLGQLYIEEAQHFQMTGAQQTSLDEQRKARAMMLGELSKQKAELEKKLSTDPDNKQFIQEIRDIDLIFVQYAESFLFYHCKDSRNLDYSPRSEESDYFYKIKKEGEQLHWERVQPSLNVVKERGIKVAKKTEWLSHGTGLSGKLDATNLQPEQPLEIEPGRRIILSQGLTDGEEFIVPVLFQDMEAEFNENVQKKALDQIRSDGELMVVWPDLVDVATPWRQEARERVEPGSDEDMIKRIRALSEETTRLKEADPNVKGPLAYSFYADIRQRVKRGLFAIQLNSGREGKRPTQYTGHGIKQSFDPAAFNFNKISPQEILSDGEINGMDVTAIVNLRPFDEGHFILVPERSRQHPQYLDSASYLEMALERVAAADRENFKILYNSFGAFGSINHLHFHAFYYGGDGNGQTVFNNGQMPLEQAGREEIVTVEGGIKISRVIGYPAHALVFQGHDHAQLAQEAFKYVNVLNQRNVAYNILISKKELIVLPRKFQSPNSWGAGSGGFEMAGEFLLYDQAVFDEITEQNIWDELQKTTIDQEVFDQTVKELTGEVKASSPGGIDFNSQNLNLQEQGQGDYFSFGDLNHISPNTITGITPIILDIKPVVNFSLMLGLSSKSEKRQMVAAVASEFGFILATHDRPKQKVLNSPSWRLTL